MSILARNGIELLIVDADGPRLGSANDATDLIGQTWGTGIGTIAIPAERLDPDFFVLRTGVAGEFVQKLVNYRMRLVVLGAAIPAAGALHDWAYESNRGAQLWFLRDLAELEARLAG